MTTMHSVKIGLGVFGVALNGGITGVPVGRANFSVLLGELEGINKAECLIY